MLLAHSAPVVQTCAGDGLETAEIVDMLARLVNKSLVLVREQAGERRFGLLETVRQYARGRLEDYALSLFWFHRGYWSEGRRWYRGALERSEGEGRTTARGRVLGADGMIATFMGDAATGATNLGASASIHRERGDRLDLAHALRFLSFAVGPGDPAAARAQAEESAAIYRDEGGARFDLAVAVSQIGTADPADDSSDP